MSTLAVVGGSLAGLSAVRAARAQGFDGRLIVIDEENREPYDRPPLSKGFLKGTVEAEQLSLCDTDDAALDVDWMRGRRALQLEPATRTLWLDRGEEVRADYVLIATGARPRLLPIAGAELEGIHYLRTLGDAEALRADLEPGKRLLVVGSGWIGAEIASTAHEMGLEVTVVEVAGVPLAGPLGATMGEIVGGLHARHGVTLLTGQTLDHFEGVDGRVTGVELADGRRLAADVVAIGIGAAPNVGWLEDTKLNTSNGVICDAMGRSNLPGISAVGDCAAWMDVAYGYHRRIEHWTGALERPAIAVAHLLGTGAATKPVAPPYFWSDQYGIRLQFAGASSSATSLTWEKGQAGDDSFLVVYWENDDPIGVLGADAGRDFTKWRRLIAAKDVEWVAKNG